jgi:hypothetical protein
LLRVDERVEIYGSISLLALRNTLAKMSPLSLVLLVLLPGALAGSFDPNRMRLIKRVTPSSKPAHAMDVHHNLLE